MRRAVQRFLPSRTQSQGSTHSFKKTLKFDSINLIQDFYIDLDEPHKVFKPGENVKGTIVLDLKKNITDVNITMTLVGFIKVKQTNNTTTVRSKPTLLFRNTTVIYGEESNKENEYSGESSQENIELPLSGLTKGEHRFPFSIKLPRRNIYTSITFEKGAISYSLRGSINHTKFQSPSSSIASSPASLQSQSPNSLIPTTKNSIQHCDKNLQIIVPINVAKIPKPSTKVAVLKVSNKALKKTISSTSTVNSNATHFTVSSDNSIESSNNENVNNNNSVTYNNDVNHGNGAIPQTPIAGQHGVKLFVDLPESGFLRGETIPLKIKVQHYKPIQSSTGVILTLIRICRVDNGPEAPIQSFRKDLSQTIAPLYIDPESLEAEISTSLKVPLECFPTIVGSELVTFQYYVEVLVNISSKNLRSSNGNGSTSSNTSKNKFSHSLVFNTEDPQEREMSRSDAGVLNVDRLKRIKNFLGLNTEIIIGTERAHKKGSLGKKTVVGNALHHSNNHISGSSSVNSLHREDSQNGESPIIMDSDNSIIEGFSQTSISPLSINGNSNGVNSNGTLSNGQTIVVSTGEEIPIPQEDSNLTEKEKLRIREAALLPSDPIIYHDDIPAPSYTLEHSDAPQLPSSKPFITNHTTTSSSVSPSLPRSSNSTYTEQSTDKVELERQRLQDLESDPPDFDYVPEYNPAGQDRIVHVASTEESESGTLRPSSP